MFISLKPVWNSTITLPNNTSISVCLYGDIQLTSDLILKDVLFVPQFSYNLIFTSAFTATSGLIVIFFPDHFLIQDHHNTKTIGKGKRFQDLYLLDL